MGITKSNLLVALFLLSFSLILLFADSIKDPEVDQCMHQCEHLREVDDDQKEACKGRCRDYYKQKQQRQQQQEGTSLSRCREKCERFRGEARQLCRFRCGRREGVNGEGEERKRYVFGEGEFESRGRTERGRVEVLERFMERSSSEVLSGVEKYRVGFLVAEPRTFVMPSHWDADAVLFVATGRGTIALVGEEKSESYNVERGDILRVYAGTPVYMINRDETERLYIIKLLVPVNTPGQYEVFHGAGGRNPESFYSAFSWNVLEAALQISRERLERLFRQQDQGSFVEASREQIRALSSHAEEGGTVWPFGDTPKGPFNIFRHRASHSNNFGQLYEAGADALRQIQDLDLLISFVNVTKDSMFGPFYNSKAIKISFVVDGEGYIEMACPQTSSSEHGIHSQHEARGLREREKSGPSYHKITGRLRKNTVFVVPAGHPVVNVASPNTNLQIVCFEINARGNAKYPLAGRRNVVKSMEREAKELAFKAKASEVERVFGSQDEQFFFAGPRQDPKHPYTFA